MLQRVQADYSNREVNGSDYDYLRQTQRPLASDASRSIRTVDLFAGCGGTALGVEEACRSLDLAAEVAWALDVEASACSVFRDNFPSAEAIIQGDIREYFASSSDAPLEEAERRLARQLGRVDLLIGGPPCQGHSDLNNFSRRNDEKNNLYFYMARAAQVLQPENIIIENVQGIPHDRSGVLDRTLNALQKEGYHISHGLIDVSRLGVPQRRRRHVVIASRRKSLRDIEDIVRGAECGQRDVSWAIEDLKASAPTNIMDTPSNPSKDNRARIEYLFENGLFDLPNEERPPCHRDKKQTYASVYGRLRWDRPSQTITSGFYSMCMGRYVHPENKRTLTAHEAARLQFFPDYFQFTSAGSRTALAKIIGNAVPMKLSYALTRELLQGA